MCLDSGVVDIVVVGEGLVTSSARKDRIYSNEMSFDRWDEYVLGK